MARRRGRARYGFNAVDHEKYFKWRTLLAKLLFSAAATYVFMKLGGWVGVFMGVVLLGYVTGTELRAGVTWLGQAARAWGYRPVQGQFYAFRGQRMRVMEDEVERCRWLAVPDLQAALEEPIAVPTLQRRFPEGLKQAPDGWYLRDQEAMAYLGERQTERAGPLRHWVERTVWYPARGRKAGY